MLKHVRYLLIDITSDRCPLPILSSSIYLWVFIFQLCKNIDKEHYKAQILMFYLKIILFDIHGENHFLDESHCRSFSIWNRSEMLLNIDIPTIIQNNEYYEGLLGPVQFNANEQEINQYPRPFPNNFTMALTINYCTTLPYSSHLYAHIHFMFYHIHSDYLSLWQWNRNDDN